MGIQGTTKVALELAYGSDSEIAWVYVGGVLLRPAKPEPTLSEEQWDAFCEAEKRVYRFGSHALKFSDVNDRSQSTPLVELWEQAFIGIDGELDPDTPEHVIRARVAHRVACAWAVTVFGPEFLLP